jgi:glucosamine-6-phosphate deaminase
MPKAWSFKPAEIIPFRDLAAIRKVIKIKAKDITKHWNPEFRIQVLPAEEIEFLWLTDMVYRIKAADDEGRPAVLITPNPWPGDARVADMLNKLKVNCKQLWTFNMDEYANERGEIAPETWEFGFMHAFKKYFYANLDRKLRPPEKQIVGPTDKNIKVYGKMIADLGNADACYSGPGWTGHLAFIEPDAPEFAGTLEEWKQMGPRVCTLSPFTLAQNSLHGSFGMSGNLCAVPPRAATIGPAEVIAAKYRMDLHSITVDGSFASWQRLTTRLVLHGPVTPRVPESILQTLKTDVYVSPELAADIVPRWDKGY